MHCAGRINLLWGSTCRQHGSGMAGATSDNSLRMKQVPISFAATITLRGAGAAVWQSSTLRKT